MSPDPLIIMRATADLHAAWMPDTDADVAAYSVPMCASTGLRHGGTAIGVDGNPFDPLDDRPIAAEISHWWEERDGVMKITGRNARNLNPIIRAGDGGRELEFAWWWIWPTSAGPAKYSAFNARDDNLTGRAWSRPFQQRALVPATWYVEKGVDFMHPSEQTFGIAAITTTVEDPSGGQLTTYALVTRAAVGEAKSVHDRMPLILPPDRHDAWLDPERRGDLTLAHDAVGWSEEISHVMTAASAPAAEAPATLF